jgi:hypothetical protein
MPYPSSYLEVFLGITEYVRPTPHPLHPGCAVGRVVQHVVPLGPCVLHGVLEFAGERRCVPADDVGDGEGSSLRVSGKRIHPGPSQRETFGISRVS